MKLRLRRESQDGVGVFRVVHDGPRTFEDHENFLGAGSLGLSRWSWLLGLLTGDEEERGQDSAGQRNHGGGEVAFGSHRGLLCWKWFLKMPFRSEGAFLIG